MAKSTTKTTTKPRQPTAQVRQPPSPDTPTIRSNDPVTNEAELRLAQEDQEQREEEEKRLQQEQEEKAKKDQELFETRQEIMKTILQSDEGFVVADDGNRDAIEEARKEGLVYHSNVQRGIEVEERYFLSDKGYQALRTTLGPDMGKKK